MKTVHDDQYGPGRRREGGARLARRRLLRILGCASLAWALALAATPSAGQEPAVPRFQSSVDLASVDVNVVDGRGQPMTDLAAGDFVVRVDGQPRKVVSAEWVSLAGDARGAAPVSAVPEGYSTNDAASGGRLIVIAVDQSNIRPNRMMSIVAAASAFVDKLSPADRVAVAGFGLGGIGTPFVADRARVKRVLGQLTGQKNTNVFAGTYTIALSEALAITRQESDALERVIVRECYQARTPDAIALCQSQVKTDAFEIAADATHASDQTTRGLRDLLAGLKAVAGPKTLILISEGFMTDDTATSATELGTLAAASRTSLYAIQIDDSGESDGRLRPQVFDRMDQGGLETLAQAARGAAFRVVGTSNGTFDRIQAELTGYYLLGVESDPRDRDGKIHPVRVDVSRNGALVRARRQMLSGADETPASPRQAVAAGLNSPLLMSALPLRVGTFALQGPERGKVQLLIHADVGSDYSASKAVSIGFSIFDAAGRTVEGQFRESRLPPVMVGVPSSLQFAAGASLPPGDYTLKLVAAEGDRVGSVEHPIHAALVDAGNVTLSTLMAGGPASTAELLTPTVGYTVSFGLLHGYVEAYGPQVEAVTVRYEVAADEKADALLQKDVSGVLAGDDRMIFTGTVRVDQLPPGKYVLRARVSSAAKPVKTLTRTFEVAPPAVLMTSAEGVGSTAAEPELFLPVDETALAQPFQRNETLTAEALSPFLGLITPGVKPYFDAGVEALAAGDYPKAETSLKRAISPDVDSTAPLAYLAATFAAAGHDVEAASAWQTALSDGAEIPQIYHWLSQALLRTRSLLEARATLEEAIAKWPADPRFTRSLAMVYALFGKGRDAIRVLERYLEARQNDPEAYRMGVDWIYHAHEAGGVVHTRVEDLRLAHAYADAYAAAKGPQLPLVQQWIAYLDNQQR